MSSEITPLKIYREWFTALEIKWAKEISENVIRDVFITSSFFLSSNDDAAYAIIDSIDDFPARLLAVIDENIEVRNIDYERLLCQQLFSTTTYILTNTSRNNDGINGLLQEKQMENLVLNNVEGSDFFEKYININIEIQLEAEILMREWNKFCEEHFNMESFSHRANAID